MKKSGLLLVVIALILFTACKEEKKEMKKEGEETVKNEIEETNKVNIVTKEVSISLESRSESNAIGKLFFNEVDGVVNLEAKFMGLSPGTHAIHIHEKADCSSSDGKSAGGHWNPSFKSHGKWGEEAGYHKGDIGNFEVDDDGNGKLTMQTNEWCIGCGDVNKDILGKAIIVHQGTDDFVSQPSGAAGARVSCGGIIL